MALYDRNALSSAFGSSDTALSCLHAAQYTLKEKALISGIFQA